MSAPRKPGRVFYGWVIVLCSVVLTALGLGMYTSTNSVFVKPVCDALGFARGQFTFHRTIIMLIGALTMPLYSRIIKRYGIKPVLLAGALVMGAALFGYSVCTRLWQFYLVAAVNGAFLNGVSFMTVGVLVSAWFTGRRGLATGLAYAGSGLGGAVMIPVAGRLIELYGWRWAYRLMGALGIAVLLVVIVVFVKNRPEDIGLAPMPPAPQKARVAPRPARDIGFGQAARTPIFWVLVLAILLMSFFASATNTHSAPYLSDLGYPAATVSAVVSFFMLSLTVAKVGLGFLYDRFGSLSGNLVIAFFSLGFPVLALLAAQPGVPWLYALFVGVASCGASVPITILILRYFGERDFLPIFSFCSMLSAGAQAASVPLMGAVYDYTGSYRLAWVGLLACSVVVAVCLVAVEVLDRRRSRDADETRPPAGAPAKETV